MPRENLDKARQDIEQSLGKVNNFKELFDLLNSFNLSDEYKQAYEEAAELAKYLVETKNKPIWDPAEFYRQTRNKYPEMSYAFTDALVRCVINYKPPVNVPHKSLWDTN